MPTIDYRTEPNNYGSDHIMDLTAARRSPADGGVTMLVAAKLGSAWFYQAA